RRPPTRPLFPYTTLFRSMGLVDRAGEAIRDLAATIEEAEQVAAQIAASTHQQHNGMEQLTAAMAHIRAAATQTAASTRQMERSRSEEHTSELQSRENLVC